MEGTPTASRGPWLAISVTTVIAIGLIGPFSLGFFEPIPSDCFEWCGLGRLFALAGISLVAFMWLATFLIVAWRHRVRAPTVAVASAALAAVGSATQLIAVITPWSIDSVAYALFQLVSLLGIGVALPAGWRIARSSARQRVARAAAAGLSAAVAVGVVAYGVLGTTWWSIGPDIQWMSIIAWSAILALLTLISRNGSHVVRVALALLGMGGAFQSGIGVLALGFHVFTGDLVVVPLIVLAAGWGLLALGWRRETI